MVGPLALCDWVQFSVIQNSRLSLRGIVPDLQLIAPSSALKPLRVSNPSPLNPSDCLPALWKTPNLFRPLTMSLENSLSGLDQESKTEMLQWMQAESHNAKIRGQIHQFTDMCFEKCVKSTSGAELSNHESSCLKNCLARFLDTNRTVVTEIQRANN